MEVAEALLVGERRQQVALDVEVPIHVGVRDGERVERGQRIEPRGAVGT